MSTAAMTSTENGALRWFQRLVWAGIVANIVLGIVSIAYPAQVLALAKVDPATPLVWPRLSAMLIILLAGFYIPAALDPNANRFAAVFAVVCRFAGTIFMAVAGGHYIIFGLFDFVFGAPQAICLYLAWRGRNAAGGTSGSGTVVAIIASLLAAGLFGWGAFHWLVEPLLPQFSYGGDYFKYGAIGNDGASGIPYPIWIAMQDVCARHLPRPQGYAALGFLYERGRNPAVDTPIGFSRAKVGVERVAINCAVCHTLRARMAADAEPQLYVGAAANTVDVLGYLQFLSRCAADERFTADQLLPAMAAKVKLSWFEKITYRFVLIPFVRKRLREQGEGLAWAKRRPSWGPGRIDPFNPVKFGMLHLADDETIGNSDMQAIWNLNAREQIRPHAPLHWDGLNNSVREVVISSALGDGTVAREFKLPAAGASSPSFPSPRSRPTSTAPTCGPSSRAIPTTISAKGAIGASSPSARSRAMSPSRSVGCGSMGRTFTTARFRPCATSSSRRRKGRLRSCAVSTWWTPATAGSSRRLAIRAHRRRRASASIRGSSATATMATSTAPHCRHPT